MNLKLMAMVESNISGKKETPATRSPGGRKVKKEKRTCKYCKKEGYHEDAACFSLPENTHLRPDWYKEQNAAGSWRSHMAVMKKMIASSKLRKLKEESLYHYHHHSYSTPLTSQVEALDAPSIKAHKSLHNLESTADSAKQPEKNSPFQSLPRSYRQKQCRMA